MYPNYLTVDDVKAITRMSNDSIRKHIRSGNLKANKVGVRYLIKEKDLVSFIEGEDTTNKVEVYNVWDAIR